jgi:hypothetical protein
MTLNKIYHPLIWKEEWPSTTKEVIERVTGERILFKKINIETSFFGLFTSRKSY